MAILEACAPSADQSLIVNIPASCARFEKTVPDPLDGAKTGDDPVALAGKYRAKLGLANARIINASNCEANIRKRFSSGK